MAKLKFFARHGHVVHTPGPKSSGQVPQYIAREFVVQTDALAAKKSRKAGHYRAAKDGFEIDSDHEVAHDICHYARQGGLWCADAETARHVGIPFVAVKFDEDAHEFVVTKAAAPAKPDESPAESHAETQDGVDDSASELAGNTEKTLTPSAG